MRTLFLLLLSLAVVPGRAPDKPVPSGVYHWSDLSVSEKSDGLVYRPILSGETTPLVHLDLTAVKIYPGAMYRAANEDVERLFIVKEGSVRIDAGEDSATVGPGSVSVVLPGDPHGITNEGSEPATVFIYDYRARSGPNLERGRQGGGSFVLDWKKVQMNETETGGRRDFFDRPTSVFERFEMHVSTVRAGLTNHAAHTHPAEEFVLMMKGDVDMQIGESHEGAIAGDVIFLESMIPHALNNTGTGTTEYFAFQWE